MARRPIRCPRANNICPAWLVAGPVRMDTTAGNPSTETQVSFFKEDLQPISIVANKSIAPLDIKGKQYSWTLVKNIF